MDHFRSLGGFQELQDCGGSVIVEDGERDDSPPHCPTVEMTVDCHLLNLEWVYLQVVLTAPLL